MLPKTESANAGSPGWRCGSAVLAVVGAVPLAACGVGAGDGNGDDADSLYAGESVDLVVPYGAGGGYDVYARMIEPYLAECLDAEEVLVQNEPGAGGLVATNATAVADPDAPRLQILNMAGFSASQLVEDEGVQYDLAELSYAGRIAPAPNNLVVAEDSDFTSFDDITESTEPVRFVATGPGSEGYITAVGLSEAYDFEVDIISGFESSEEARTAVIAGDADVEALVFDSQISSIDAGDVQPLVLVADDPVEQLDDVPLVSDYPTDSTEGQTVVESLIELGLSGRTISGPPGMSEEHLAELREGFQCAMQDDELVERLVSQGRPVDYAPGDEVTEQVTELLDGSPEFRDAIEEAF